MTITKRRFPQHLAWMFIDIFQAMSKVCTEKSSNCFRQWKLVIIPQYNNIVITVGPLLRNYNFFFFHFPLIFQNNIFLYMLLFCLSLQVYTKKAFAIIRFLGLTSTFAQGIITFWISAWETICLILLMLVVVVHLSCL